MRLLWTPLLALFLLLYGCAPEVSEVHPPPDEPEEIRRVIRPDRFPADRPYSFGVQVGETLYLAGQLGLDPATGQRPEGMAGETRQAMLNLGEVLKAAGMDYPNLVKCHVYLADMDDYTAMNETYGGFFQDRVPARTTVEAAGLPREAGVQIGCVAFRDLSRISVVRPEEGTLPMPLGPYSAAVWAGDMLYLSGMGGRFPEDERLPEPLGAQVTQTLVNIGTTLEAAGLGFGDVVSSKVYVTEREEIAELPPAYDRFFTSIAAPPRELVFLPRLPGGIKTEITFAAAPETSPRRVIPSAGGGQGASRGLLLNGTLFARSESGEQAGEGFEEQFREVLSRLEGTLAEAGMGLRHVTHVQVYLADLADLEAMNRIFRETFPQDPPARATIQVLPEDGKRVQASLVAVRRSGE